MKLNNKTAYTEKPDYTEEKAANWYEKKSNPVNWTSLEDAKENFTRFLYPEEYND
jgi:hypothetical protein